MGDKDIVSKELIKEIGRDISLHILGIELEGEIILIDKEWTRIEKRDSDIVFRNQNCIIHIEIQNDNHKDMELRMLRYYSDILFEYRECTIEQYIIYIGKDKCRMKNEIIRDKIGYKYAIIDLKDIACEDLLYHSNPSAVALSILCNFSDKDKQMVVNTIIQRIGELTKGDERVYRNYLKKVNVLSGNRELKEEMRKGIEMFTVDIEKTPLYEIAVERGMERGMQKGMQRGLEKGMKRGMERGMERGVLDTAIVMIQEFKLAIDDVALKLDIKKEALVEYMKEQQKD